ncbi:MAG: tRNA pseudouridine38-40 synthase [Thermosediminibacterales bacterium]|nr:tRNA pseudouridine38-40 synthase [Thermosediminibacterales bacterium]
MKKVQNIKLVLEYDGTNYHGWQRQKNALTIQEVLESALETLTGQHLKVIAAGRTDAGVHARQQTVNFKIEDNKIPVERFHLALNSILPPDIVVKDVSVEDNNFHARYSCKGKTYCYRILNSRTPSALMRNYVYHISKPLDIQSMKEAAKHLVGTHDFSAFRASGSSTKTSVRTITKLDIIKNGKIIEIWIEGTGFLYNMVRIIAGSLVDVGEGKLPPERIVDILESKNRLLAGKTLPPQGLCLEKVIY